MWRVCGRLALGFVCAALVLPGCGQGPSSAPGPPAQAKAATPADESPKAGESLPGAVTPGGGTRAPAGTDLQVVAMVAGFPVLASEYRHNLVNQQRITLAQHKLLQLTSAQPIAAPELTLEQQQKILDATINDRIFDMLAMKAGIDGQSAELMEKVRKGMEKLKEHGNFERYVKISGQSEKEVAEDIRRRIMRADLLREHTKECESSPGQRSEEYERMKTSGEAVGPESADFHQVWVSVAKDGDEDAWKSAEARALDALQRILGGEPFAEVAKELSDDPAAQTSGGRVTGFSRVAVLPEISEAIFSLPIGEMSDPIKAKQGWLVVRVDKRRAAGLRSYEDLEEWIGKKLRAACRKEIVDEMLERARTELPVQIFLRIIKEPRS